MSYMAILKYGRNRKGSIAVFGQTPQICGTKIFDQLLSWHGDEHWPVTVETCFLFRVVRIAPGIESRDEMHGREKEQALREVLQGLAS